jgi:YggT family protein
VSPAGLLTVLASARTEFAEYLSTVIYVYIVIIFAYIVIQLLFSAGIRPPYSRTTDRLLGFLRDVCEPFIGIFRRLSPRIGPLDLSPTLAIFTLIIVNAVIVEGLIRG